ncbi:S41 family peptidase [Luteimicrobium sp. NPDC057192]|uniref:S41 family peptidase n=1 Tax=Luteimicrobium sp. NPDC057192 TaxID=3346042 RepID=UPI003639EFB6
MPPVNASEGRQATPGLDTVTLVRADGYLGPDRSGVDWLIDPDSPAMRRLGPDIATRTPDSPVDVDALLDDLALLPRLIRERHVFVVLGRTGPEAAGTVLDAWTERLRAERPTTWGDAIGDVAQALREALDDNHHGIVGNAAPRVLRPTLGEDPGPAWESAVRTTPWGEVATVRIRTLSDSPEGSPQLEAGAADRGPLGHERVVVDLRGNGGGNDEFVSRWIADAVVHAYDAPSERCLSVGDKPVMAWDWLALETLRHPDDPPPASLLPHAHVPAPGDELRVELRTEHVPAGANPFRGRMLVLVDGGTGSSGESSTLMLRDRLGARVVGVPSMGLLESANVAPYVLPRSGLTLTFPTQWVETPEPMEFVGIRPDVELDATTPLADVADRFDELWAAAEHGI